MKWRPVPRELPPFNVRRCWWCWGEIYACPTHCRFLGWKHMATGLHGCWPGQVWRETARFAWRGPGTV